MPPPRAAMLVLTAAATLTTDSPQTSAPAPDFDLDHEGYGDYRAHELTPLVDSKVGKARPDVALLHLGTNDVPDGRSASGEAKLGNKWADTVLAWRTH